MYLAQLILLFCSCSVVVVVVVVVYFVSCPVVVVVPTVDIVVPAHTARMLLLCPLILQETSRMQFFILYRLQQNIPVSNVQCLLLQCSVLSGSPHIHWLLMQSQWLLFN